MEPLVGPILFDDERPATVGSTEPPATQPEKPAPAPAPAPIAPVTQLDPQAMAQAIVMANQEQARQAQERAAWEARQRAMAQVYEPPAVPKGEEAEALILEAPALASQFEKLGQWTSNALRAQAQMMWEAMQQQLAAAQTPVYEMRRETAMERATYALEQAGVQNADAVISDLEMRLRSNPNTYWDLVTNPLALTRGAQMLAAERGGPAGLGPTSLGYSPATQPGGNAYAGSLTPEIELAQQRLRTRLRPEYLQRLYENPNWNAR